MNTGTLEELRRRADPFLYVAFIGHGVQSEYRHLIQDWKRLNIFNVCWVCLDYRTYQWLNEHAPQFIKLLYPYTVDPSSLKGLWSWKTALIVDLMQANIPTVMVDVDTQWVQNPTLMLAEWMQQCDVLVSLGHDYPTAVYRRHGFTLCGGIVALSATPAATQFAQEWDSATRKAEDDDVALNALLLTSGQTAFQFPTLLRGAALKSATGLVQGRYKGTVQVGILPWVHFPRSSVLSSSTFVAHFHQLKWRAVPALPIE